MSIPGAHCHTCQRAAPLARRTRRSRRSRAWPDNRAAPWARNRTRGARPRGGRASPPQSRIGRAERRRDRVRHLPRDEHESLRQVDLWREVRRKRSDEALARLSERREGAQLRLVHLHANAPLEDGRHGAQQVVHRKVAVTHPDVLVVVKDALGER
eukprot:5500537-Prymnesium_polylepis.1